MRIAKSALPLLFLLAISSSPQQLKSFRELQWKYPHVRTASKEKDEVLKKRFEEKAVTYPPRAILLRAFKQEGILDLWAAGASDKPYVLVHEYPICASSGSLGPKRRFGDEQVPEGFYELDCFNPQSNFFLSLHIKDAVGSVRIIDMQAQEEIALGIEAIQLVKAFRHLFVAKAALGPQRSRRSANSILVHEHVRLV